MKTAGEILKNQRVKKNWTLERVAGVTRIQPNLLSAIEEDNLVQLPKPPFIFGLVRNYAKSLGLNSEEVLAVFRREYDLRIGGQYVPLQPLSRDVLFFGLLLSWRFFFAAVLAVFLGILIFQYWQFSRLPFLIVSAPLDGQTINGLSLKVSGRTDSGSSVSINGKESVVKDDGSFETVIDTHEGENVLMISATNKLKKETQIRRTVIVKSTS